jgi:hypothetical protein
VIGRESAEGGLVAAACSSSGQPRPCKRNFRLSRSTKKVHEPRHDETETDIRMTYSLRPSERVVVNWEIIDSVLLLNPNNLFIVETRHPSIDEGI